MSAQVLSGIRRKLRVYAAFSDDVGVGIPVLQTQQDTDKIDFFFNSITFDFTILQTHYFVPSDITYN